MAGTLCAHHQTVAHLEHRARYPSRPHHNHHGAPMTPLMQQFKAVKSAYPDALVLFQVGDFFELFYDDARTAAATLGITLTQRGKSEGAPIPLCGVPCHAGEHYITKLIQHGHRVVLCEQVGMPEQGKLVSRKVTQIFTPGTITDPTCINPHAPTLIAAAAERNGMRALAFCELITGTIELCALPSIDESLWHAEITCMQPREFICNNDCTIATTLPFGIVPSLYRMPHTLVDAIPAEIIESWIAQHADATTGALIKRAAAAEDALQLLYRYLQHHAPTALERGARISWYAPECFMQLDAATQRTLELTKSMHDGSQSGTVISVLDHSVTPMGSRMIRKWLVRPLQEQTLIAQRQNSVTALVNHAPLRSACSTALQQIGDLERIVGRIVLQRATLVEFRSLAQALAAYETVATYPFPEACDWIATAIRHAAPALAQIKTELINTICMDTASSWMIASGVDEELDTLRTRAHSGNTILTELEHREREATGIAVLKIKYNGPHGYAFEIPKTHRDAIPPHYELVQTLVGRDRYTTPELKQAAYDLMSADERATQREKELFAAYATKLAQQLTPLRSATTTLATLDGLLGLARAAIQHKFQAPRTHTGTDVVIIGGRHPVVETSLKATGDTFVANDLTWSDEQRIWLITGPNMGGKSTFLRQTALIALLHQIGSWVPATRAVLPLFDRICTRVGASDHLAAGKSTFYVEMEEVAAVCRSATARSLVLLDEIGRGTSTYDGMAIARAVIEYLATTTRSYALCATHYHELIDLAEQFPTIALSHAACRTTADGIIFLHRILPGAATSSFGIAVARTAGLPASVIDRATKILETCETKSAATYAPAYQLKKNQNQATCPVTDELRAVDADELSPRAAWDLINRWKKMADDAHS